MRRALLATTLLLAACNWGTRPSSFPLAHAPEGAPVAVRVKGEAADRLGELLAVDSTGVVVRTDRIVRILWARLDAMDVGGMGASYDVHFGERVGAEKIARLALISRFPQGIAHLPVTVDSLIARAMEPTTRYADRRVAVDEGYVRVGVDFPSMGEHWLKASTLGQPAVDPAHPSLLIYATIDSTPRLLGVGYVIVTRGDTAPIDAPGWPEHWHEHSGLLAEESGATTSAMRGAGDTHVWVMHVWTALQNPDAPTAADNWALPYLRAGLPVPSTIDADAARAVSLAVGGDAFVAALLTDSGLRTSTNATAVDAAIADARKHVTSARGAAASIDAREWRDLVDRLERIAGPGVRAVVAPAHAGHR